MFKNIFFGVIAACVFSFWCQARPLHPLDALEKNELAQVVAILKKENRLTASMLFPNLTLQEPPKESVLAFRPGKPFQRQVFATLYDREKNKTFETVVDLNAKKVLSWKELPGVNPPVMLSEFEEIPAVVKADQRWQDAMQRRGIKNFDDVAVDIWAYGTPDTEHSEKKRLLRAVNYYKGKGLNFYARPIDGLSIVVNANEKKVEQVIDTEILPIPPNASELDAKALGPQRKGLKPLKIIQPEGPSFTVRGNEVRWQNWIFRFTMHPREGLVLQLVQYNDNGKIRPVLYRASLADMMVPYGHNDQHWTWRAAFDEGEYGIGRYSGPLLVGQDVPANSRLFDAVFADDFGKPYVTKNAVALYERDGGLLWKHFNMYPGGGNESRRARQLVLGFITTISNYDYGLNWIFHQDGVLELEAQLTGIMLAKGSALTTLKGANGEHDHSNPDSRFGHLVAPNVVAPHHQHFFSFRLDLDVDGRQNSVAELNSQALPSGSENPALNAFEMTETSLASEKEAVRDLSFAHQRKWKIYNPALSNSLGYHPSYILLPSENAAPYLLEGSALLKRGGFVKHPIWFTQYAEDEMYAAGTYPTQRKSSDGLPVWIEKNRSLKKEDVVLWYNFAVTHAPRPEEWPVMTTHRVGFKLIPAGFFEKNPALDVPK